MTSIFPVVGLALVIGAITSYLLGRRLALRLSEKSRSPDVVISCATVGAIMALLPSLFFSYVVGGNLGVALAVYADFGEAVIPFLAALGIAIFLVVGLVSGTFIGCIFGMALSVFVPNKHRPNNSLKADGADAPPP